MFNNILVVCVGNICRSPMAEGLFKEALKNKGKKVHSAGLGALVDKPADSNSVQLLEDRGVDILAHRAKQLTVRMLADADLVLVMERDHVEGVTRLAPEARGKTMLLGKWNDNGDIPDPYKKSREVFQYAYELIESGVNSWLKYIK